MDCSEESSNQEKRVQLGPHIISLSSARQDRIFDNQETSQFLKEIEFHKEDDPKAGNYGIQAEQMPDAFKGTSEQPILIEEANTLDGYLDRFNELSNQIVAIKFPSKIALNFSNKPSNILQNSV